MNGRIADSIKSKKNKNKGTFRTRKEHKKI